MFDPAKHVAERQLLENLRTYCQELRVLLDKCSGEWGFDDPIYRFYHQSFKVYYLQDRTLQIVRALEQLSPERPLHPSFREIIEQGTGKVFELADNRNWTPTTRPILEAYFHARFFLDVAIRCADIEEPPTFLPSGYAALLYLYGLR